MPARSNDITNPRAARGHPAIAPLPGRWVGAVPNPWVAQAPEPVRSVPVSPFMERLRTPMPGRFTRVRHVVDLLERVASAIFGNLLLRTAIFAFIGFWIGRYVDDAAGPYTIVANRQVVALVNWAVICALAGVLLASSVMLLVYVSFLGGWEWLVILVILGSGLTTAFTAFSGRLANALAALTF